MKKILFLHGFFATGSCPMARALKEAFEGTAVVLTPDLPLHPKEALKEIRSIIDREQPDLLIGNSCGSFLAQMLAPVVGIPALLGNPYFMMTEFLKERIGEHEYKAPRRDGNQRLVIDEALIEEFAELEAVQFDHCNPESGSLRKEVKRNQILLSGFQSASILIASRIPDMRSISTMAITRLGRLNSSASRNSRIAVVAR